VGLVVGSSVGRVGRTKNSVRSLVGLIVGSSVGHVGRTKMIIESKIAIQTILPMIFI
jgi:hypothetical protein